LVWDKSLEKDTPKEMRRGIILTGNEGVSWSSHVIFVELADE
jgi:hypothetical protein